VAGEHDERPLLGFIEDSAGGDAMKDERGEAAVVEVEAFHQFAGVLGESLATSGEIAGGLAAFGDVHESHRQVENPRQLARVGRRVFGVRGTV